MQTVKLKFIQSDGVVREVDAQVGHNLLQVARQYDIDLEGACEGSLACSTCHLILDADFYNNLPAASEDENDMLDLAFDVTATSRLGCQVIVTPDMEGQSFRVPQNTRNLRI